MFLVIGIYGSRQRKIRAAYMFFLYTLLGSLFMLVGVVYIYLSVGTTSYEALSVIKFSSYNQKWLWLAFFVSFAAKAHVEAPTAGSVILAGILLKLGSYGFLRFSLVFFPEASTVGRTGVTAVVVAAQKKHTKIVIARNHARNANAVINNTTCKKSERI